MDLRMEHGRGWGRLGGSGGKKWKGESDAIIFLIDFIKIEKRISNSLQMHEIVNKFNLKKTLKYSKNKHHI